MLKTCLLGFGRTGKVVAEQILNAPEFDLVSVVSKPGSPRAGHAISEFINTDKNLVIADSSDLHKEIKEKKFKVAIDFTSPEATMRNARILAEHGVHMVIGTTGFNNMQLYELKSLVQQYRIGLVYAPNISLGINILLSVVKTISRLIPQYDVEITETGHRDKKDAPSGTAIKIADEIEIIKGGVKGRRAKPRRKPAVKEPGEVTVHSIRAGGNLGVHQVLFASEHDEIEITHRTYSQAVYAEGALKAATFIAKLRGFYHMEDVMLVEKMDREMRLAANRLFLKFN